MLILTRRVGEKILIGDNITIETVMIKGKQVRFGIEAPQDVVIHREEIFRMLQEESNTSKLTLNTGNSQHGAK